MSKSVNIARLPDPRPRHVIEGRPRWSRSRTGDYFDRLVTHAVLEAGWDRVRTNRGAPGKDGVTVEDFAREADAELRGLASDLVRNSYRPGPLRLVPIPKKTGGHRWLRIPCIRDRVVQSAAHALLSAGLEPEFEPWSFGYRRGYSVEQALALARGWMAVGFDHVIDADIEGFFDSVPHERMVEKLEVATADPDLSQLVARWLAASDGVEASPDGRGLPQGAPVSPILANLYLDDLDEAFSGRQVRMVRFADDFLIFLRSGADARSAMDELDGHLAREGLRLHPEKTRIVMAGQVLDFLGQAIVRATAEPNRPPLGVLGESPPLLAPSEDVGAASGRVGSPGLRPLYLYKPGRRLERANDSFAVIENGGEAARLHSSRVDRIEVGPRAEVDADALRLAVEADIPVALVSGSGRLCARVSGPIDRWGARHLAQARACLDPEVSLAIARALVHAQIIGRKELLYDIHHAQGVAEAKTEARQLQRRLKGLATATSIGDVRGIEAHAARIFWPAFGKGLLNGMSLHVRGRRTKENPVSVLLDIAAALLLRDMEAIVLKVGLHLGFGILHEPRDAGAPCAWDLAEPFRAPLVEACVREAVNTGSLGLRDFEERDGRYRLRGDGLAAFIAVYERIAARRTKCHRTRERVGWRERMRRDAEALVRSVERGEPFVAAARD